MKAFNYDAPKFTDFDNIKEDNNVDRWFELKRDDPGGDYNNENIPKSTDIFRNKRLINKAINTNFKEFKENINIKDKFDAKHLKTNPVMRPVNLILSNNIKKTTGRMVQNECNTKKAFAPLNNIEKRSINQFPSAKPKVGTVMNSEDTRAPVKYNKTVRLRMSTLSIHTKNMPEVNTRPEINNFELFHSTPHPPKTISQKTLVKKESNVVDQPKLISRKYEAPKPPVITTHPGLRTAAPKTQSYKPFAVGTHTNIKTVDAKTQPSKPPIVNNHLKMKSTAPKINPWNNINKVNNPTKNRQQLGTNPNIKPNPSNQPTKPSTSIVRRITVPIPFSFDTRKKTVHQVYRAN